jgi:hypothetical protein
MLLTKGVGVLSKIMQVYDPAMCCSTGVCGPSVDPVLVRFAGDMEWLVQKGVQVKRYNLSQQPEAFAQNPVVVKALSEYGTECLPLVTVDNEIKLQGKYPTRVEMAAWFGIGYDPSADKNNTPLPLQMKNKPDSCCCG